ncbi:MAG TPA: Ig-like domain-containing protein, partial [Longimicrobiales bacterium]|nr:Ig-like domain-containing protein [Longimicrobiales bacterium]
MAAGWTSGCANQGAPPGGPEDRRPPVIVRTEPEPFATVTDPNHPIRFHFDERISESVAGSSLEDAVTVSPRSGAVDVSHDSRTLSVRVEGGLRPGLVYRVTLLPVVRDLFGNQLRDPFELVFSTGAEPAPTTIAGEVWDRITGQGLREALVHAVGPDSLVHVARTDDQGIFAFRYLPAGAFLITGFEDVNRDGEVDAREVKGYLAATVEQGDTLLVDVSVLPPDTTAAVLARATALDSVTVVLELDDYVDPASVAYDVRVELAREGVLGPEVSRLLHEHEYAAYVERVTDSLSAQAPAGTGSAPVPADPVTLDTAALDTVPADAVPPDTVPALPDTARAPDVPVDTA